MRPSPGGVAQRAHRVSAVRAYVQHIQSRVDLIPEMGRYIQSSGGKRVRPAVLLMAARLLRMRMCSTSSRGST